MVSYAWVGCNTRRGLVLHLLLEHSGTPGTGPCLFAELDPKCSYKRVLRPGKLVDRGEFRALYSQPKIVDPGGWDDAFWGARSVQPYRLLYPQPKRGAAVTRVILSKTPNLIGWIGTCVLLVWMGWAFAGMRLTGSAGFGQVWVALGILSAVLCVFGAVRGSKWFLFPGSLALLFLLGVRFLSR